MRPRLPSGARLSAADGGDASARCDVDERLLRVSHQHQQPEPREHRLAATRRRHARGSDRGRQGCGGARGRAGRSGRAARDSGARAGGHDRAEVEGCGGVWVGWGWAAPTRANARRLGYHSAQSTWCVRGRASQGPGTAPAWLDGLSCEANNARRRWMASETESATTVESAAIASSAACTCTTRLYPCPQVTANTRTMRREEPMRGALGRAAQAGCALDGQNGRVTTAGARAWQSRRIAMRTRTDDGRFCKRALFRLWVERLHSGMYAA